MSHDNRFSKTNYLKTNLLKQIKKNIFIDLAVAFISTISISIAKVQKKPNTSKQFCFFLQLINKLNRVDVGDYSPSTSHCTVRTGLVYGATYI